MRVHLKTTLFCLCCLLPWLWSVKTKGADIYVAPGGTGSGTKSNPAGLQNALDIAKSNGMTDDILYLRTGTYQGNFIYNPGSGEDEQGDLEMQGGWNSDYAIRTDDPSATVLDGQSTGRVLKFNDWETSEASGSIILENFTVRNGRSLTGPGGGLYVFSRSAAKISLKHLIIENNSANGIGGGCVVANGDQLAKTGGLVVLADLIIRNNRSKGLTNQGTGEKESGKGGGCYIASTDRTRIINTLVYDNAAGTTGEYPGYGGGLYLLFFSGSVYLTNNSIADNTVYQGTPGWVSCAGGLYLDTDTDSWGPADVWIENTIVYGNSAPPPHCGEDIANDMNNDAEAVGSTLTVSPL